MKYIDADKLKGEIRKRINKLDHLSIGDKTARIVELHFIDRCITSLQQEQPSEDLESEIEKYFQGLWPGMKTAEQCNTDMHFTPPAIMRLARHFYELGLNARNEK